MSTIMVARAAKQCLELLMFMASPSQQNVDCTLSKVCVATCWYPQFLLVKAYGCLYQCILHGIKTRPKILASDWLSQTD